MIHRIVGYSEYANALHYLDKLAAELTEEEFSAIEEIIQSEPEFKIFTNLSRKIQPPNTVLAETQDTGDGTYGRHGFRWITALARVEVAAILTSYSLHPDPFGVVVGSGYDLEEYRNLIQEGARTHVWSLNNDRMFRQRMERFRPDALTLTYLCRMNLATAFIRAAGRMSMGNDYSALQIAELKGYLEELNAIRAGLRLAIQIQLSESHASKTRTTRTFGGDMHTKLLQMCNEGICREFR